MGQPFRSPGELATPTRSNLLPGWPRVRKTIWTSRGVVLGAPSWGQRGFCGELGEDSRMRRDESEEERQELNMAASLDLGEAGPSGA